MFYKRKGGKTALARLSNLLIKRINELNSMELNHLAIMCRYQDDNGIVKNGVHYDDFSFETCMSVRHHYNCLKSLEEKGIYEIDDNKNIQIAGNHIKACLGAGYITLPDFAFTAEFLNSNVLIKRATFLLLKVRTREQIFDIGSDKLQDWLNLNRFSKLQVVIDKLSKWFNIGEVIKDCKDIIFRIKLKLEACKTTYKNNLKAVKEIKRIFRKKRLHPTQKDINDFAQLLNQYKNKFYLALDKLKPNTVNGAIFRTLIENLSLS